MTITCDYVLWYFDHDVNNQWIVTFCKLQRLLLQNDEILLQLLCIFSNVCLSRISFTTNSKNNKNYAKSTFVRCFWIKAFTFQTHRRSPRKSAPCFIFWQKDGNDRTLFTSSDLPFPFVIRCHNVSHSTRYYKFDATTFNLLKLGCWLFFYESWTRYLFLFCLWALGVSTFTCRSFEYSLKVDGATPHNKVLRMVYIFLNVYYIF